MFEYCVNRTSSNKESPAMEWKLYKSGEFWARKRDSQSLWQKQEIPEHIAQTMFRLMEKQIIYNMKAENTDHPTMQSARKFLERSNCHTIAWTILKKHLKMFDIPHRTPNASDFPDGKRMYEFWSEIERQVSKAIGKSPQTHSSLEVQVIVDTLSKETLHSYLYLGKVIGQHCIFEKAGYGIGAGYYSGSVIRISNAYEQMRKYYFRDARKPEIIRIPISPLAHSQ